MRKPITPGTTIESVEARAAARQMTKYVATLTDGSELVLRTSAIHNYRFVGVYQNDGEKGGTALGDSYVDVTFHARRDLVKDHCQAIVIDGNSPAVDKLRKAAADRKAKSETQESIDRQNAIVADLDVQRNAPSSMNLAALVEYQNDNPTYRIPRNEKGQIEVVDHLFMYGTVITFSRAQGTAKVDSCVGIETYPLEKLTVQEPRPNLSSYCRS